MNALMESLLMTILRQLLTEEVLAKGRQQMVEHLKQLAAKTDNRIDDYVVEVVAEALGVKL